jgi:hypothetical protein
VIAVQLVEILYTKKSRGAPGATRRNALPRGFPLASQTPYHFERYRLFEDDDFVPRRIEIVTGATPPREQRDLVINDDHNRVTLGLLWAHSIGLPPRRNQPQALVIHRGETACLIINGRYTNYSGQLYTEATYNVAFGDAVPSDTFAAMTPSACLDMRADLF